MTIHTQQGHLSSRLSKVIASKRELNQICDDNVLELFEPLKDFWICDSITHCLKTIFQLLTVS